MIRPPPRALIVGDVVRGVVLWGIVHVGVGLVSLMVPGSTVTVALFLLNAGQVVFAMGVVAVAAALDVRVRRENIFRENLGVPPAVAPVTAALVFLILEVGVVGPLVGVWGPLNPPVGAVVLGVAP